MRLHELVMHRVDPPVLGIAHVIGGGMAKAVQGIDRLGRGTDKAVRHVVQFVHGDPPQGVMT